MYKKIIALLVALSLFVLPVFASTDDIYILDEGMKWLCEVHHVIEHGDDICPSCYAMYAPSLLSIGNSSAHPTTIYYRGSNGLEYFNSYLSASYDSSTGSWNGTISSAVADYPYLWLYFSFPDLWNGDYSKPTDYPYYIWEFDIEAPFELSMVEDVSQLQFGVTFGSAMYFQAQYQKQIQFSEVSSGKYQVILTGEAIRSDQLSYAVAIKMVGAQSGDVFKISNPLLQTSNDYEADTPVITPPGPMSPPTDSDQWQDEQFAGAVNPELSDKLNDANTKIEQIEEIESSVIDQLDEHYTQVSPDNIEFSSNLISSMRWIGSQFENCLDAVDSYGLMGVVTLPMFVGLCLLIIGRGGQVMAATRLHIQSKRRDDDA